MLMRVPVLEKKLVVSDTAMILPEESFDGTLLKAPITPAEDNSFAESDALLASWSHTVHPGWDNESRQIVQEWNRREAYERKEAGETLSQLALGTLTYDELTEVDPTANIRTSYVFATYEEDAAPAQKPSGLVSFLLRRKTPTSYQLAERMGFDLRESVYRTQHLVEDTYDQEVIAEVMATSMNDPSILEDDERLNATVQQAKEKLGPITYMTELEKLGTTVKTDVDYLPKEGTVRFWLHSVVLNGVNTALNLKPVASLRTGAAQIIAQLNKTLRNFDKLPLQKRLTYGALGAVASSAVVGAGLFGVGQLVPSESDFFQLAASFLELENS